MHLMHGKKINAPLKVRRDLGGADSALAGAEGLEPSARGFGDRCSTN